MVAMALQFCLNTEKLFLARRLVQGLQNPTILTAKKLTTIMVPKKNFPRSSLIFVSAILENLREGFLWYSILSKNSALF